MALSESRKIDSRLNITRLKIAKDILPTRIELVRVNISYFSGLLSTEMIKHLK